MTNLPLDNFLNMNPFVYPKFAVSINIPPTVVSDVYAVLLLKSTNQVPPLAVIKPLVKMLPLLITSPFLVTDAELVGM